MGRLVELSKGKIKEGRREPRSQKELLVYLLYIEMLGHDTTWAQATVIQQCSDKNLAVKKVRAEVGWEGGAPLLGQDADGSGTGCGRLGSGSRVLRAAVAPGC